MSQTCAYITATDLSHKGSIFRNEDVLCYIESFSGK